MFGNKRLKIVQLRKNEEYPNLQSWCSNKRNKKIFEECKNEFEMWQTLEENFCCDECLHVYKIYYNNKLNFDSRDFVKLPDEVF